MLPIIQLGAKLVVIQYHSTTDGQLYDQPLLYEAVLVLVLMRKLSREDAPARLAG